MILVDANLLVYAHAADLPQHGRARKWLDGALSGRPRVGLPWQSLLAFVRLMTNPRVFQNPESISGAWAQVEEWLEATPAWIPVPGERHKELLRQLIPAVTGSALVPDAHLAALALEHGLILHTTDSDFARFQGLRWTNPIA